MATRVIYGDVADNAISSVSTVYPNARAMIGTLTLGTVTDTELRNDGTGVSVGQVFNSPDYTIFEGFIAFDTTGISGASAATLSLFHSAGTISGSNFTIEARLHDWGTGVTTGDVVAGASLSGRTLLASITAGVPPSTYRDFTDVAFPANINGSGFTRLIINSDRQRTDNTPTGFETARFTAADGSNPPKLTITDGSTQGSQTLNGGTTTFTPTVTGVHDLDLWGAGGRPVLAAAQERGAGGAAYSFAQYTVSSLSNVTVQVGNTNSTANTAGTDTWFGSSSAPDPLAKGGTATTKGLASSGRGIVKFDGGDGVAAQGGGGSRGGSGGGSSAGTAAIGVVGVAGSGSSGGAGGTAPSGGGNGGNGGNSAVAGSSGTVPGGGAGGGGNGADAGNGAAGKIIVYWYATAAVIGPGGGLHHTGEGWGDPGVSRVPQTLHPIEQGIGT